jgi:hypothetical protein
MTTADAIRFLDHQARECRGRDAGEALCLLLPAIMEILDLERMDDLEALAFRHSFKKDLDALPNRLARPVSTETKYQPCGCFFVCHCGKKPIKSDA